MIKHILTLSILFITLIIQAQTLQEGDYRSKQTGNWNDFSTWQIYESGAWRDAIDGEIPGGTFEEDADNVYLEPGITVILTQNQSCKDLHLGSGEDVIRINTQDFKLNVWGKMRYYSGSAPGSTDNKGSGIDGWIQGTITLRGTKNRVFMESGSTSNHESCAGWTFEFAFDPGVTGTSASIFRCGHAVFISGNYYDFNSCVQPSGDDFTPKPGDGSASGTFIVKKGAKVQTGVIRKWAKNLDNAEVGLVRVEQGGKLQINFPEIVIAKDFDLKGKVSIADQPGTSTTALLSPPSNLTTPSKINEYGVLEFFANVAMEKKLANDILVKDSLIINNQYNIDSDTVSITTNLNGFKMNFTDTTVLQYVGKKYNRVSNVEFPDTLRHLSLANPAGVELNNNKLITKSISTKALSKTYLKEYDIRFSDELESYHMNGHFYTTGQGGVIKYFKNKKDFTFPIANDRNIINKTLLNMQVKNTSELNDTSYVKTRLLNEIHPYLLNNSASQSRYMIEIETNDTVDFNYNFDLIASNFTNGTENCGVYIFNTLSDTDEGKLIGYYKKVKNQASGSVKLNPGKYYMALGTKPNLCLITENDIYSSSQDSVCSSMSSLKIKSEYAISNSYLEEHQWWVDTNSTGNFKLLITGPDSLSLNVLDSGYYSFYTKLVGDECEMNSDTIAFTIFDDFEPGEIGYNQQISKGETTNDLVEIVSASGRENTTFAYQWYESNDGTNFETLDGETEATLAISNFSIENSIYYKREVTDTLNCNLETNQVYINVDITALNEFEKNNKISIYPNPAKKVVYINSEVSNASEVRIISLFGILVDTKQLINKSIDVSDIPSGTYILEIGHLKSKVIIQ